VEGPVIAVPISKENAVRYPIEWPEISFVIRWIRALGRCECTGECTGECSRDPINHPMHLDPVGRCAAANGMTNPLTGARIVLTVAHLDHTPENCHPANLRAMCQSCHLRYDRDHHAETRRATRARKLERAGWTPLLWDLP
jgi:hypothetical protein